MTNNITLMIGGTQGEGIVSTGNILIKTLSRLGYFTYGFRNFSSRIKGGHTNYIIEINTKEVLAYGDSLDILIAFDMESIEVNIDRLKEGGLVIYDSIINPENYFVRRDLGFLSFPFTDIAKKYGSCIMKNTSLLGLLGRLLNIHSQNIKDTVEETYKKKGQDILSKNFTVLDKTYEEPIENEEIKTRYNLNTSISEKRASMIGNEAIAFGALMAGCRFMAAYPITPASEIMEYLSEKLPDYGGIVLQTEDEIAAITMSLGSSYAGSRAMTASSGPGISLMMEGIGLAGMAEIPIVIVDVQRVGPSTGLPTKHEQSDIEFLYHGAHGEIPLIIVTPYSVEECFYQSIQAFNLAEKYQCPVIILSDLALGLSRQTIKSLDKNKITIDRGKIASGENLEETKLDFRRFDFTSDNISQRTLPGFLEGIHKVTGLEHSIIGTPNNYPDNRKKMMDKRLNKIRKLESQNNIDIFGTTNSSLLVLSIGSNYGIIKKVVEDYNLPVAYGAFKMIKPLPVKQLKELTEKYSKILIVENNARGQLASIIKQKLPCHDKFHNLLKYDGTPFKLAEIKSKIEEMI
ncbi:MAG: 2-oxoglutarate/2-oxoacid ferredoxin oxidoreductase subunit alpha [Candidatus Petromonas sp.]|nr:2-oxoglutarate/2-oxoacid ferredoxin oxidoreductase subunit alpha [Candidatus Petromonas sp.]